MACKPGDVFVTRNIAKYVHPPNFINVLPSNPDCNFTSLSQVHASDDSILSVLAYAVGELGVEHVVIVGHSQCGGVAACMSGGHGISPKAPLGRWLAPLANLAQEIAPKEPIELVDANVRAQVQHVLDTDVVGNAWSADPNLRGKAKLVGVHGWVYDIEKGRLRDLGVSVYA